MADSWTLSGTRSAAARAAASGDAAVDAVYRSYWSELCGYVRKTFGGGPPEPEEVAQGAFVRFAAQARPDEIANPRAFLYTCARNIVLDHQRHEQVRERMASDLSLLLCGGGAEVPDGERVASARQRLEIVEAAIRAMRPRRRKVLIMHAIHELNYSEIARRLGLSQTRVTQLFAAAVAECERALRVADGVEDGGGGRP